LEPQARRALGLGAVAAHDGRERRRRTQALRLAVAAAIRIRKCDGAPMSPGARSISANASTAGTGSVRR
jgi:hypothetical protein